MNFKQAIWDIAHRTPEFRGKRRLVSFLARPRRRLAARVTREGVHWELFGYELNEFYIATQSSHSPEVVNALEARLSLHDHPVLWDVGANIGAVTFPLAIKLPQLSVVMFEPSPEPLSRLMKNLSLNPEVWGRIKVFALALYNDTSIGNFFIGNEEANQGVSGLALSKTRVQFPLHLQMITGDEMISRGLAPVPSVVKMDVEGFELEVLSGMARTLKVHAPEILFEHSVYRFMERGQELTAVISFLVGLGYSVRSSDLLKSVDELDLTQDQDLIAIFDR